MRMTVCVVRDRAADVFGRPIFAVSRGQAVRSFTDQVNEKGSELNKHPKDYELYLLGEYDDGSGQFICGVPEMISRGEDVVV
uniref:DNA binding protein VP4 n=1 Tax=Gokushovirinae environmental samples TaxID=1478972 RepID=A0A2R3UAE8_9VIRU|nr:DNA binding protein VP4 [Gokushovirinae environmental samples]